MENTSKMRSWAHPPQQFRVDLDHRGDWCVWQQMPSGGWTAVRSCVSHNEAVNQAAAMNARHARQSVTPAARSTPTVPAEFRVLRLSANGVNGGGLGKLTGF